ncbi:site-specific integrase [Salsuginibacillus halophilus]|nr:site-specific integrase [Salsuginibacillus halophilus]
MQSVEPIRDKQDIQRMKRLLRRRNMRDYFMFVLGINTGLRVGDLLTLRVLDVRDRTHIVIQEQKRGKTKRFKLNSELQLEIQDYTEDMAAEEYLFPSKKTNLPITREQAYRIIKNAADQLGIDGAGTHTMRKTFGYHLYNQTKDIARLQKIFNHSAPEVTMRYLGITQDELDDLVDDFIL